MGTTWTCPYCNRPCTIGDDDIRNLSNSGFISKEYGNNKAITTIIVCPNKECRQRTIFLQIDEVIGSGLNMSYKTLFSWKLLPESEAKHFPEYIPNVILNDYRESCLIKNKSPKASATLSRRCLQGMIRDFWGIKKGRLVDEISELQDKVDISTWEAIDSVRNVGNIGAHMEKDVNLIVEVEPEEAGMLIWLIETLFEEWYIAKHDKDIKMKAIVEIAKNKVNTTKKVLDNGA